MTTVGFIEKRDGISYFYVRTGGKVTVISHEGAEGYVRKLMIDNKASAILGLFEQFLQVDKKIIDTGKNVYIYDELKKRIQDYIEWGHQNREMMPESVIQNGLVATKYMNGMIDMISPQHTARKNLIFLKFNVTQTVNAPYNI